MNKEKTLIPWSLRKKQHVVEYPINHYVTGLACPKCGKEIYKNMSMVYLTMPQKHAYICLGKECDFKEIS